MEKLKKSIKNFYVADYIYIFKNDTKCKKYFLDRFKRYMLALLDIKKES